MTGTGPSQWLAHEPTRVESYTTNTRAYDDRSTTTALLYMDWDRHAVEDLSTYKDPFDLRNCLLDFSYGFEKKGDKLRFTIKLLNPSSEVEAVFIKHYRHLYKDVYDWVEDNGFEAPSDDPTGWNQRRHKAMMDNLPKNDFPRVFLRWGYGEELNQGLSHVHKGILAKIDYDFRDNKDKLLTLTFVDISTFLSDLEQRDYTDVTISVPFGIQKPDKGKMQRKLNTFSDTVTKLLSDYVQQQPNVIGMVDLRSNETLRRNLDHFLWRVVMTFKKPDNFQKAKNAYQGKDDTFDFELGSGWHFTEEDIKTLEGIFGKDKTPAQGSWGYNPSDLAAYTGEITPYLVTVAYNWCLKALGCGVSKHIESPPKKPSQGTLAGNQVDSPSQSSAPAVRMPNDWDGRRFATREDVVKYAKIGAKDYYINTGSTLGYVLHPDIIFIECTDDGGTVAPRGLVRDFVSEHKKRHHGKTPTVSVFGLDDKTATGYGMSVKYREEITCTLTQSGYDMLQVLFQEFEDNLDAYEESMDEQLAGNELDPDASGIDFAEPKFSAPSEELNWVGHDGYTVGTLEAQAVEWRASLPCGTPRKARNVVRQFLGVESGSNYLGLNAIASEHSFQKYDVVWLDAANIQDKEAFVQSWNKNFGADSYYNKGEQDVNTINDSERDTPWDAEEVAELTVAEADKCDGFLFVTDMEKLHTIWDLGVIRKIDSFPHTSHVNKYPHVMWLKYNAPNSIITKLKFRGDNKYLAKLASTPTTMLARTSLSESLLSDKVDIPKLIYILINSNSEITPGDRDSSTSEIENVARLEISNRRSSINMTMEKHGAWEQGVNSIAKEYEIIGSDALQYVANLKESLKDPELKKELMEEFKSHNSDYTEEQARLLIYALNNQNFINILFPPTNDGIQFLSRSGITEDGGNIDYQGAVGTLTILKLQRGTIQRKSSSKRVFRHYYNPMTLNDLDPRDVMNMEVQLIDSLQEIPWEVKIQTLGIPEMDVPLVEMQSRRVILHVHETRDPDLLHWLSGIYRVTEINHSLGSGGYFTNLTLLKYPKGMSEEGVMEYSVRGREDK